MAVFPRESHEYSAPTLLDRTLDLSKINVELIAFVGVVIVSIIAHLWALGHMAMHHDESIHAWTTWRFYTGAGAFTCAGGRTASTYCYDPVYHGPSLYSLTLLSYLLFGDGEAQARLPEAIAGILLVASSWMLRPYLGRRGTLIAAVLLAFAPSLLYFTRFARHDGLMILWTLWIVIGFFRWLDTGRARYLYLFAVGAGLALTTHELYYILFFLFGSFLLIRVLTELLPRRKVTIGSIAILIIALVIMVANPPITEKLRAGGLALIVATVLGMGLLFMRIWDETPLLTARALVLWRHQRNLIWTALGILATIFVLLYSTYFADPRGILDGLYQGISYWLGTQQDYARGDQPWYYYFMLMPLYEPIALFTGIGAAIYLFTRRPPTNPSLPLDALGGRQEDDQGPVTNEVEIPDSETQAPDGHQRIDDGRAALDNAAQIADDSLVISGENAATAGLGLSMIDAQPLFPLFLAFWFIGAFIAFSWAGEKMPWLLTHIALPGNLLAAWALGKLLDAVEWRTLPNRRVMLIPVAVVLLAIMVGVALWRLSTAGEGQQGQADLLQGLIPLLIAGGLIYGILTLGQSAGTRLTLALSALAVVGLLGAYELRASWMVVYDHPDTPRELLVFVQTSPDVPLISANLHELAINQTRNNRTAADPVGGHSMPVIMDSGDKNGEYSLAWPFQWYLRDFQRIEFRQADFFQNATAESFQVAVDPKQPNGEKEFAPAVMVSVPHMTDATRQALEANYVKRYDSKFNWWFPYGNKCDPQGPGYSRFYYSSWISSDELTKPPLKGCGPTAPAPSQFYSPWAPFLWPLDREHWHDTWRFLLYREIPAPLRLDGREMQVWVRKDLAPVGTSQASTTAGGPLKLVSEQVIGAPGKGPGQLDQPHGLAVDTQGNVYVADTGNNRVEVFGPDGKLIREIGSLGNGDGQFNEPHGLAVDTQGNLYVADTWNARIDKFDKDGKFLKSWGEGNDFGGGRRATMTDGTEAGNAAAPLGFYGPRAVTVDKQGNVYIADTGNKRIVVTDSEGNYLYQLGHAGGDPGAFSEPIGVAVDGQGNLYVADTWNSRVQVFGPGQDGKINPIPSVTWSVSGWQPSTYDDPFVAASEGGQVFASVPGRNMMIYANARGDVLLRWGGKGDDDASLVLPSGMAVGADGSVYVVDHGNGRVLRFRLPKVAAPQPEQ